MAKTGAVTITNIPLDLRQAFKARCVMQGKSMSEELIRLLREECGKRQPPYRVDDDSEQERRDY